MLEILIVLIITAADQFTKYLAVKYLKPRPAGSISVIKGVFSFTYTENRGAAFGILQDRRWLFIVLTIVVAAAIIYYLVTSRTSPLILRISLSMILGGAIGNFIDRVRLGYVIDMFDFELINYPVFNVADSFVVIGTIILAYYVLFISDASVGTKSSGA